MPASRLAAASRCGPSIGPSWATGRPSTVMVKRWPLSARRSTSLTLLRSSRWGMVTTPRSVAYYLRRIGLLRGVKAAPARSAAAGMSLQEYLRAEIVRNAALPTPAELIAEIEETLRAEPSFATEPCSRCLRSSPLKQRRCSGGSCGELSPVRAATTLEQVRTSATVPGDSQRTATSGHTSPPWEARAVRRRFRPAACMSTQPRNRVRLMTDWVTPALRAAPPLSTP